MWMVVSRELNFLITLVIFFNSTNSYELNKFNWNEQFTQIPQWIHFYSSMNSLLFFNKFTYIIWFYFLTKNILNWIIYLSIFLSFYLSIFLSFYLFIFLSFSVTRSGPGIHLQLYMAMQVFLIESKGSSRGVTIITRLTIAVSKY